MGESADNVTEDAPVDARADAGADALLAFRLRTVPVGVVLTVLTLFSLVVFFVLPGHAPVRGVVFWPLVAVTALSLIPVRSIPWARLLSSPRGQWALYVWSAADIAMISVAVAVSGGGLSELWVLYALTTIFFAASYPARGQALLLAATGAGYAAALAATGWDISASALFARVACVCLVFLMAMFLAQELRASLVLHAETSLRARLAEEQARRAEWFRALVQDSNDIVTSFDVDGRIIYISPAVSMLGYDADALVGGPVAELVHPDDLDRVTDQIVAQFESGDRPAPIEYRGRAADGTFRYLEGVATNLLDEPTVNAVVVNARDVTDRKRAELLLASQSDVLARIAARDPLDTVLRAITEIVQEHAHALCTVFVSGASDAQLTVLSSDPRDRDGDGESEPGYARDIVASDGEVLGVVRLRFADARFATEGDRQVADVAAHLAAIALERDATESRLAHQARHDSLTGLANRQVFVNTLEHALTSARTHETIAVLFVDLDGFKEINDNLGHHVGDQVLVALGHRLAGALRMHDVIARFGGDEFVALCRVESADHARQLAESIRTRVHEPISVGVNHVALDASVGVTLAPVFADDGPRWVVNAAWVQAAADELLRQADSATNVAKQRGGGRTEFYGADQPPPSRPRLRAAGEDERV